MCDCVRFLFIKSQPKAQRWGTTIASNRFNTGQRDMPTLMRGLWPGRGGSSFNSGSFLNRHQMCWELVPIPFKVRIWNQTGLKIILEFPTTVMLLLLFSLPVQDVYKTEMHPTEKCAKNEKSYILESLNILTTWFIYNYSRGTDLTSILR